MGFDEISWLIRWTLEHCDDFDCARGYLNTTWINALGYITLAGTKENEGVIITRNLTGAANEAVLDDENWF